MLILLPPSEGKSVPRRGKALELDAMSFPSLTDARERMLDALVSLCTTGTGPDLPRLSEESRRRAAETLGLGKTQTDEVDRNARLRTAHTARAERVYSGVLYEALSLASLDGPAKQRATRWIAITSSLFGVVRPSDAIPAYRLAGNVALPGLGVVSTYWNRQVDETLHEAAGRGLVVDLRSSTYSSFWRPSRELSPRVVTVRVLHEHNGARRVVSHFNKATKGRIVRAIVEEGSAATSPRSFADQLGDLGWKVEEGPRHNELDVVVEAL